MTVYEKRTYDITVGQMGEVIRLYRDEGRPAPDVQLLSSTPWGPRP